MILSCKSADKGSFSQTLLPFIPSDDNPVVTSGGAQTAAPVFQRGQSELPFEGRREMGMIFITDTCPDLLYRLTAIQQITTGYLHTIIKDMTEHGGTKYRFETSF